MSSSASENASSRPVWNAEKMIYEGAVIPGAQDGALLDELLRDSGNGSLRVFGYGSLTWNPGSDGPLTRAQRSLGRAVGWKRCWAQASADHRGTVGFPGIVCTLLGDDEVRDIQRQAQQQMMKRNSGDNDDNDDPGEPSSFSEKPSTPSMAEGVIYTVPPELVEECVAELDFREKGGYAREIINVIESSTGNRVKALLYRGTPDNPAFWSRPLLDLHYAAATMAVAIGPSGRNDHYLYSLDDFLSTTTTTPLADSGPATSRENGENGIGDVVTRRLATIARNIQTSRRSLCFLVGCGSNQHNQLLLRPPNSSGDDLVMSPNPAALLHGDEAHEWREIVLEIPFQADTAVTADNPLPRPPPDAPPTKALHAGGGHSALLLENGSLYLWGWNDNGQLGRSRNSNTDGYRIVPPLSGLQVERAALGHSHTLVIEKGTGMVYAFGDDTRGQVTSAAFHSSCGESTEHKSSFQPTVPSCLVGVHCVDVAAGLFHSAVITAEGELITFGSSKQCLFGEPSRRWHPEDGARLISVACGQRHTIVLDEYQRVWTFGNENKHGQLGRKTTTNDAHSNFSTPKLVDGFLGTQGSGCCKVDCGWSHNVVLVQQGDRLMAYGWGRNDKGQLGHATPDDDDTKCVPQLLPFDSKLKGRQIHSLSCGSESLLLLTEPSGETTNVQPELWACGWNEHGNLGVGHDRDVLELNPVVGAKLVKPPSQQQVINGVDNAKDRFFIAAGGAHVLAMKS